MALRLYERASAGGFSGRPPANPSPMSGLPTLDSWGLVMSEGKHSYVRFFPSDWIAGTARMGTIHRAVYFEVCCYIWDHARPCPEDELPLMFTDLPDWAGIVDILVRIGKLHRTESGLVNDRAMAEATRAFETWHKKSEGGRKGMKGRWQPNTGNSADNSADNSLMNTVTGELIENQNQNQNQSNTPHKPPKGGGQSVDAATITTDFPTVPLPLAREFLTYRKSKAPLTPTAWSRMANEIRQSNLTPEDAISECMARGWRGFKSEWVDNDNHASSAGPGRKATPAERVREAYRREFEAQGG